MRNLTWIVMGWAGMVLLSALGSRIGPAHIVPDATILVAVFLATRREPIVVAFSALALGYLTGRQALAPGGLHESALVLVSMGVYLVAGNLAGSGGLFFALTCGLALMAYHAMVFGLLLWQRGAAGFASWATAILVPDALMTFVVALLCHPFMVALERRLTQDKREGLTWR